MNQKKANRRQSRQLIRQLAVVDFKLRYQGSILGYLWSLLKPLAIFIILYLVFVRFLRFGEQIEFFSVYLLLGIVVWSFFFETTSHGLKVIVDQRDLIRRINFPRLSLLLAGSVNSLINLGLNLIIVAVFLAIVGADVRLVALWLPLLLVQLYLLALALSLFLATLYVRFRDIGHIWEIAGQGLFYLTPILYPLNIVPETAAKWLLVNPLAQIIQDLRYVLVTDQSPVIDQFFGGPAIRWLPLTISLAALGGGLWYFQRQSPTFAERV